MVGRPIHCPQRDNPTQEELDHYHNLYCEELQRVYRDHQATYQARRDAHLAQLEQQDAARLLLASKHVDMRHTHPLTLLR